jgi:LPS sulfotransferase NodH
MKKSNFVIFTEARTGSTLLKDILDKQENFACYGELFGRKKPLRLRVEMSRKPDSHKPLLNFLGEDESKWFEKMNVDFKTYLNICSNMSDNEIFGYKIFMRHIEKISNYEPNTDTTYLNFLKKINTKVIILERKNVLLRYISNITAQSIGEYTSMIKTPEIKEKVYKLNPIKIDYNLYVKYNQKNKKIYDQYLKYVKDYDLPYVHIYYEDFTGENYIKSFQKIFRILDLDFIDFVDLRRDDGTISKHKKINIYKIEDKVLNYQNFKAQAEKANDTETLNFLKE